MSRFVVETLDLQAEVHRGAAFLSDELFLDHGHGLHREDLLGLLDSGKDARFGRRRFPHIDLALIGEAFAHVVQQQLIEVVAAKARVAVAGEDLHHSLLHLHDGHVEGAAAKVVNQQSLQFGRGRVVGQCGRCRLVDDADDFQAGQLSGGPRRLALHLVEERGDGDYGLADAVAEVTFGALLQAAQDDRGNLLRRVVAVAQGDLHVHQLPCSFRVAAAMC